MASSSKVFYETSVAFLLVARIFWGGICVVGKGAEGRANRNSIFIQLLSRMKGYCYGINRNTVSIWYFKRSAKSRGRFGSLDTKQTGAPLHSLRSDHLGLIFTLPNTPRWNFSIFTGPLSYKNVKPRCFNKNNSHSLMKATQEKKSRLSEAQRWRQSFKLGW